MGAGDRPEGEDEPAQREGGGDGILEQLQSDIVGRQGGGHDAGADDGGDEQRGAEELGKVSPPCCGVSHQGKAPLRGGGRLTVIGR
jgi:hypothetical protein